MIENGKISQIPLPLSSLEDPVASEVEFEVWERADALIFANPPVAVCDRIINFYYLGFYKAQVANGGHSQLVYNMDIGEMRSPQLTDRFIAAVEMVGAPEFSGIAEDFSAWLQEFPEDAKNQTGFEGGRSEFLDTLDRRFSELDESLKPRLTKLLATSTDPHEAKFLQDCIERKGHWNGDLNALEVVWLLRSGMILPVPDSSYHKTWTALFA